MAGNSFILDTSALMAFIEKEEGAERVREILLKKFPQHKSLIERLTKLS